MKPLALAISGIGLALWNAAQATGALVQEPIGPQSGVSAEWVFQAGVLLASAAIMIRFGMLLASWKRALDKAILLGDAVSKLERRMSEAEDRLASHDASRASHNLLVQEHSLRLGLRKTDLSHGQEAG